jgi:peptidase S24-like protein
VMKPLGLPIRNTREFLAISTDVLHDGHAVRFRAEGWSMYPIIRDGDIVEVAPVRASQLCRGDVLLCRIGDAAIAHRLVGFNNSADRTALVLRGDAAFAKDAPVPFTSVIGRVTDVRRDGNERRLATPGARLSGLIVSHLWRAKRWVVQRFWARINQTSARSSHARP